MVIAIEIFLVLIASIILYRMRHWNGEFKCQKNKLK